MPKTLCLDTTGSNCSNLSACGCLGTEKAAARQMTGGHFVSAMQLPIRQPDLIKKPMVQLFTAVSEVSAYRTAMIQSRLIAMVREISIGRESVLLTQKSRVNGWLPISEMVNEYWGILTMQHLFNYIDYRDYLYDYYNTRKQETPWFSLRVFGSKLGLNAAYLLRIMQKQEHLSVKKVSCLSKYFGFKQVESEYFEALIGFSRAKTDSEATIYFERISQLKGGVKSAHLDSLQYEYYNKWYYSAVLAVIGFFPVKSNYRQLSKVVFPQISTSEAKEAVELLEKLQLIKRNADGFYERTLLHISTGSRFKSLAVRKFQKEMIHLSENAIERLG